MATNSNSLDLEASSSQRASITDASQTGLDFSTTPFWIRCWVKRESTGAAMAMVAKHDDADQGGFGLIFEADDKITFSCGAGASFDTAQTAGGNTSTNYQFITALRNGTNLKVHVDGVEVASGTDNAKNVSDSSTFHIGAFRSTADLFFDGLIDEVAVGTGVVTGASLYADRFKDISTATGVISYWKLNNDYIDGPGPNDLTASGSPIFTTTVPFAQYGGLGGIIAGEI